MPEFLRKVRVMVVFGTRPEAIKLWPVVLALRAAHDCVDTIVCSTGQHRELLDPLLLQLPLKPDIELNVFGTKQSLETTYSKVLVGVGAAIAADRPDVLIVQGDVTSTVAAAMAAMMHRVPVAHVEAGLRTSNKWAPWPEEMNRRMLGQLAEWHFAPTPEAQGKLLGEGLAPASIEVVGNTGIDSLMLTLQRDGAALPAIDRPRDPSVLITFHRREVSHETRIELMRTFARLAADHPSHKFILPMHPSVAQTFAVDDIKQSRLEIVPPMAYFDFVKKMVDCELVITDSGGVQEEAAAVGTPTLVLRNESCRPEALAGGGSRLVGTDPARLDVEVRTFFADANLRKSMAKPTSVYGDGQASGRIVRRLVNDLGGVHR
jgi:UDP-N-acetylglucosamine 2-epimerase (non-hydrolysing)